MASRNNNKDDMNLNRSKFKTKSTYQNSLNRRSKKISKNIEMNNISNGSGFRLIRKQYEHNKKILDTFNSEFEQFIEKMRQSIRVTNVNNVERLTSLKKLNELDLQKIYLKNESMYAIMKILAYYSDSDADYEKIIGLYKNELDNSFEIFNELVNFKEYDTKPPSSIISKKILNILKHKSNANTNSYIEFLKKKLLKILDVYREKLLQINSNIDKINLYNWDRIQQKLKQLKIRFPDHNLIKIMNPIYNEAQKIVLQCQYCEEIFNTKYNDHTQNCPLYEE